jgi:methyl-accepting chemotaxis protein
MRNLKLNHKLIAGFGLVLAIFAGVGVLTNSALLVVRRAGDNMRSDATPSTILMNQIQSHSSANFFLTRALVATEDAAARSGIQAELAEHTRLITELFAKYEKTIITPEDRQYFEQATRDRELWLASRKQVTAAVEEGNMKEAQAALASAMPVFSRYIDAVKAYTGWNERRLLESTDRITSATSRMSVTLWGGLAVGILMGLAVAVVIGRSITRPMAVVLEHVGRIGQGDLEARSDYTSRDEVGTLAEALNRVTGELKSARAESVHQAENERHAQLELQGQVDGLLADVRKISSGDLTQRISVKGADAIGQLGEGIEILATELNRNMSAIAHNAQTLAASAEELSATSQEMASNSEETSGQAGSVSSAAEQVSKNVQTVATAGEEMTASIKEIAKNAHEATKVTMTAVEVVRSANATISKLGDSSMEIGKVVKVITSIAEQTNLLALNATIEAARAGEAGKGFAVVANEVKELAKETAKATEDISLKVDAIQGDSAAAVKAIEEIRNIINQVNDIATTIAGAVEEQTATTNEIGRNVAEASRGATEIARGISGVAEAAQSTASGASATLTAAASLAKLATELQAVVGRFRLADQVLTSARGSNGTHHGNGVASRYSNGLAA